ncbi:methionyl-tRNA formyltransferase [Microvirga calopogonii]|uniref:methionyl-tRNA formyltransferase n=1 Tax=Microvirga calopogonii TaxID=2078013 RepID=UPI0013B35EB6|nr:formyltransferase family protein [Microvirga calopogonii]
MSQSFSAIKSLAEEISSEFVADRYPHTLEEDLLFVVGWQFLFQKITKFSVVFHDSLLPKYRGFAPTVTALINGEPQIGVTALSPTAGIDVGPIVGQLSAPIDYPIKIKAALELQAALMVSLAARIYSDWINGSFITNEQDHSLATYSIWRDGSDYEIDWSQSSSAILRMIDAVGFPYSGARTSIKGHVLTVEDASEVKDLKFEIRQPGKIWAIEKGRPVVVCGSGLLKLNECRGPDGSPYDFRQLRVRLGRVI